MVTEPSIVLSHNNQNINCYFVIFQVRRTWKRVRNFVNVLIGSHNVTEEFVTSFFLLYVSLRKFVSRPSPHDNDTRKSSSSSLKSSFKEWVEIYDLDMEGKSKSCGNYSHLVPKTRKNVAKHLNPSVSRHHSHSDPKIGPSHSPSLFSKITLGRHFLVFFSLFNFSLVIGEQE